MRFRLQDQRRRPRRIQQALLLGLVGTALVAWCGLFLQNQTKKFHASSLKLRGFRIVLEDRNPWAENDDRPCDIHGARNGDIVIGHGTIYFTSPDQLLKAVSNWQDGYYVVVRGNKVLSLEPRGRDWFRCYQDITPVWVTGQTALAARQKMGWRHQHLLRTPIETGPGVSDRPPATVPRIFPSDPYGGEFYEDEGEFFQGDGASRGQGLYHNSSIRFVKYIEDKKLAASQADKWVQYYVNHLVKNGFEVIRRDTAQTIGVWARWGARLVNSNPDSIWLFTKYATKVEIDIEFGYGQPEVWYKIEYAEYGEP